MQGRSVVACSVGVAGVVVVVAVVVVVVGGGYVAGGDRSDAANPPVSAGATGVGGYGRPACGTGVGSDRAKPALRRRTERSWNQRTAALRWKS